MTIPDNSPMYHPGRALNVAALLNARDLGGYPSRSGGQTRWRSLLRSDDLARLTPAGMEALVAYGLTGVIDLRWPEEADRSPSPFARQPGAVHYEHVSLLGASQREWHERSRDHPKEQVKVRMLEHARPGIRRVLGLIAAAPPGPLLIHCISGKDRTGLIAALMLHVAGAEPDAIIYDYELSSHNLREPYLKQRSHLPAAEVIDEVRCPAAGVHNMLMFLAASGGVQRYLEEIGLRPEEIERLRARL